MKTASPELITFFAEKRADGDSVIAWADCFTLTMIDGTVLRYTDVDVDVTYAGYIFSSSGPIIEGLRYQSAIGLDVDQQELKISANSDVQFNGTPILRALANGAFDLCVIQRDRVFFRRRRSMCSEIVGGVLLFHGRFIEIKECGRLSARVMVADDTIILSNQMPRNVYSSICNHALYDEGCGLDAELFATSATVGSGSTDRTLKTSAAVVGQIGGIVQFTSGAFLGVSVTVKNVNAGQDLTLMFPLRGTPAAGDTFKIYRGCDHTSATCKGVFDNLARFRGFPFVPPPQYAQ